MNLASLASWVLNVFTILLICYMVFADMRYTIRMRARKNWPATSATIDGGIVGFRGLLSSLPSVLHRVHFTYKYRVDGLQHDGRFFLFVNSKKTGEEILKKLVGRSVPVKYDDRKPEIALLMDRELAGKRVMQGPSWTYR